MPRPKRRAPIRTTKAKARSPSPEVEASDSDAPRPAQPAQSPERGRRRTTRSTAARPSEANEETVQATNEAGNHQNPTTGGHALDDAESGSSVEIGRRAMATPAHRRDTTGLDLADDDVFGDLDDSFEDGEVPHGMQSTDTSSLNLSNFKRRGRQSSIIGRNDPPIRPSSRGGNTPSISSTLHFGTFRRRAREPSILGTGRKPLRDGTGTGQEDNSESEEEDFLPEAESTPLINRRRTQPAPEAEEERDVGMGIGSPEVEDSARSTRSRKRKSEETLLSSERPEKISRIEVDEEEKEEEGDDNRAEEPDEDLEDGDSSSLSSISSPLGPPPALPDRPVTPVNDDDIMAPPASSDSEDDGNVWPDIHTLAKRRRRPSFTTPVRGGDNMSDMSSPPSLTHSPNYAQSKAPATRGRAATRRQPSPEVTTADLTSMLPKRRYRKQRDDPFGESEGEYDTTEMPQGEDELSYVDSRTSRRRQGSRAPSARPASRGGRAAHSALKPRQIPGSARHEGRNNRTYSRRSSDKENENENENGGSDGGEDEDENEQSRFDPLPDDTFDNGTQQSSETTSADELKQATRKFREVDRWELEYEEVTQSSSPSGAR